MDKMVLVFRELDQCFKGYLNRFPEINHLFSILYTLNFNNNMVYIPIQFKYMIEW